MPSKVRQSFSALLVATGVWSGLVVASDSAGAQSGDAQVAAWQQTLVLGRVSQDPVKMLPRLQALPADLADHLAAAEGVLETYSGVTRYDPFVGEVSRDLESVRTQFGTIQDLFD